MRYQLQFRTHFDARRLHFFVCWVMIEGNSLYWLLLLYYFRWLLMVQMSDDDIRAWMYEESRNISSEQTTVITNSSSSNNKNIINFSQAVFKHIKRIYHTWKITEYFSLAISAIIYRMWEGWENEENYILAKTWLSTRWNLECSEIIQFKSNFEFKMHPQRTMHERVVVSRDEQGGGWRWGLNRF